MKTLFTAIFFSIASFCIGQDRMPNMQLKNLKGRPVSLQQISKDQLVIIDLWATWCVPCIKELTTINNEYDQWQKETGVKIYAISVDDARTAKRVRPMVNGKGWDYNILVDPNHNLKRALGVSAIPMVYIVKNNKILYQRNGYAPGSEAELLAKLKEFSDK